MFRLFPNEIFKQITIEDKLVMNYAISNYGRIVSFTDKPENGRLLIGNTIRGYRQFRYSTKTAENKRKTKHLFLYRVVAEYFIPKTSEEQTFVLHLDYNKSNDFVGNLKWATKEEAAAHIKKSPYVIEAKKKLVQHNINSNGHKLTESQVIFLKKKLLDPNRKTRLKMLAKQFGVSEMTLHRIRTGENWGHVKV